MYYREIDKVTFNNCIKFAVFRFSAEFFYANPGVNSIFNNPRLSNNCVCHFLTTSSVINVCSGSFKIVGSTFLNASLAL